MPVGSNAQVPANWRFLQILAQSRFHERDEVFGDARAAKKDGGSLRIVYGAGEGSGDGLSGQGNSAQ